MKRVLCSVISLMLILGLFPIALANEGDKPSSWAQEYVEKIKNNPRYDDGVIFYDYQGEISRAEFAYIGVKVYEELTGEDCVVGEASFKDTEDVWVLKAKNHGIVNGVGNNEYAPNKSITREQLAVLFVNILDAAEMKYSEDRGEMFRDDSLFSSWAKESIYIAKSNGILNGTGDNKYSPHGSATREQAMIMISNVLEKFGTVSIADLHALFDTDKNCYVLEQGSESYVISFSSDSMIQGSEAGLTLQTSVMDDVEIKVKKYNSESQELIETPHKLFYINGDEISGDGGIYTYDDALDYDNVSVDIKDPFSGESINSEVTVPLINSRLLSGFNVTLFNGISKKRYINLEIDGVQSLSILYQVDFTNYNPNYLPGSYQRIPVTSQKLVGSNILVPDVGQENIMSSYKNDGQHVFVPDEGAILYSEEGLVKPQYINNNLEDIEPDNYIELPDINYEEIDMKYFYIQFSSSNDVEKSIRMFYTAEEFLNNHYLWRLPSMEGLGYDIVKFAYTSMEDEYVVIE